MALGATLYTIDIDLADGDRGVYESKAAPRVAVYTHKDPDRLMQNLRGERIHRAQDLEIYAVDRALVGALASRLDRRLALTLSVQDRDLFITIGEETLTGNVRRLFL